MLSTLLRLLGHGRPAASCSVCGESVAGRAVVRVHGAELHRDCVGYRLRHQMRSVRG